MTDLEFNQRNAVIAEARTWLRTPFHHRGKVKGAGCDCAFFPIAVYQVVGLIPKDYEPPYYPMDWHLHKSAERYLDEVRKFASEVERPEIADFVVFHFGRTWAHGGIVVRWPEIIHSSRVARSVSYGNGIIDGELVGRQPRFFSLWKKT